MKYVRNVLLAAAALATSTAAFAGAPLGTTAIVSDGTASVFLNNPVVRALYNQGVTLAYTDMNGSNSFDVRTGVLGIRCGRGEITLKGGLLLTQGSSNMIEVRDWQYEDAGNTPFVSALVVQNGVPVGRIPIFAIYRQNGLSTCSELRTDNSFLLSYGKGQQLATQIVIDPAFARALNKVFNLDPTNPVFDITGATVIGSLNYTLTLTSAKAALGLVPTN